MSQEGTGVSEAEIAVHWGEESYFHPPLTFVAQANLTDPSIRERFSLDNFPEYFKEFADLLTWDKYWEKTLDTSNAPFYRWFVGGKLNASYNCIDRQLAEHSNKTAIHFVPSPRMSASSTSPTASSTCASTSSRRFSGILLASSAVTASRSICR